MDCIEIWDAERGEESEWTSPIDDDNNKTEKNCSNALHKCLRIDGVRVCIA